MSIYPFSECNGDAAITVQFGDQIDLAVTKKVFAVAEKIKAQSIAGIVDIIPAYASLTLRIDLSVSDCEQIKKQIEPCYLTTEETVIPDLPLVEVPACYDPSLGIDIELLAKHSGLSINEVIRLHTKPVYLVYMLGFMPGFLYLGGMDPRLSMPRKSQPRIHIPQGAIGIAGQQTGVYPFASPGGWQIIARTPVLMFDGQRDSPAIAQPLQRIKFIAISLDEYQTYSGAN